jgi:hypothetical protein
MKAIKEWNDIFKTGNKNNYQPSTTKLCFRNEDEIKIFPKQKLRKLITRPAL